MTNTDSKVNKIVLCGGCFWCTEAVFKELQGVLKVSSGYIGGSVPNPSYLQICSGTTGHAEGIEIEYDPNIISDRDVLTVFFASHDPTTLNKQGADTGTQYRSAIFYTTDQQKNIAEEISKDISSGGPAVVTELLPYETFYIAEDYHQEYYKNNKDKNPYCQVVINPKLEKLQARFAELLNQK